MIRSSFEVVEYNDLFLVIRDLDQLGKMSVTNDIENVCKYLYEEGYLKRQRLLYYDSDNRLDEVLYKNNGEFLDFTPYFA